MGEGRAHKNSTARNRALPHWLDYYNTRRPHSALGDKPPITRAHNVSGQDTVEIRLLCDHRDTLVNERTRLINRLRAVDAAILIGQTAGAERFKSDAQFARLAGVAPDPRAFWQTGPLSLGPAVTTARSIGRYTSSRSPADARTRSPAPACSARKPRARLAWRPCAASSAISPVVTTGFSVDITTT